MSSSSIPDDAVLAWVDGSMRPPACAGGAYIIQCGKTKKYLKAVSFASRGSTINQMELEAVNRALDYPSDHMVIYSDSSYVIKSFTAWIKSWIRNNWMNQFGEPVKNRELIETIHAKIKKKKFIRFVKVKSHSGVEMNDAVDKMAQDLTRKMVSDITIVNQEYHL